MNHETHHVLEQICKHMHIPEIKSISRRSRLHTEASKELKLGLSSFDIGLLASSLFMRYHCAILDIPHLSACT